MSQVPRTPGGDETPDLEPGDGQPEAAGDDMIIFSQLDLSNIGDSDSQMANNEYNQMPGETLAPNVQQASVNNPVSLGDIESAPTYVEELQTALRVAQARNAHLEIALRNSMSDMEDQRIALLGIRNGTRDQPLRTFAMQIMDRIKEHEPRSDTPSILPEYFSSSFTNAFLVQGFSEIATFVERNVNANVFNNDKLMALFLYHAGPIFDQAFARDSAARSNHGVAPHPAFVSNAPAQEESAHSRYLQRVREQDLGVEEPVKKKKKKAEEPVKKAEEPAKKKREEAKKRVIPNLWDNKDIFINSTDMADRSKQGHRKISFNATKDDLLRYLDNLNEQAQTYPRYNPDNTLKPGNVIEYKRQVFEEGNKNKVWRGVALQVLEVRQEGREYILGSVESTATKGKYTVGPPLARLRFIHGGWVFSAMN